MTDIELIQHIEKADEILSMHMVYNMGRTLHQSEGEFYEQVKQEIEKL